MDSTDRKVYPIRLDDYSRRYEEILNGKPDMPTMLAAYVKDTVYSEDAEGLLAYGDFDYVVKRLETENPLFYMYRAIHNERIVYYRLKIVTIGSAKIKLTTEIPRSTKKAILTQNQKASLTLSNLFPP